MASSTATVESASAFREAIDAIPMVRSPSGDILTKQFLDVCRLVLPVIDKFGSAMAMVKSDIGGNIARLETRYNEDTSGLYLLYDIVRREVDEKTAKGSKSCSNGLLWLTRAMDFLMNLFDNLLRHPDWTMTQASTEAYAATLKKYHGWIASGAFTMAMKLTPERKKFMEMLGGGESLSSDIEKFLSSFSPLLLENHQFLKSVGLDDMKAA
ncbi:hypothetical protein SELMODRAFT_234738 [Selaginella moellendorffii]|uniref:Glycolipid transfer protein domain-containing protein n=1 Tax=Selaginella moellendorffii TaxID=88036 RepID=D8SPI2_SELML|nr:glycolipid transfer protein 1 [Selaginella moellendorffii]EFJ13785.1 hypothetical protein SELMODRAFT_234738 [Selaginella moellendorffii]|eukprot:XP_002985291.1 glycolipid transfer protein 1 [Selaginella moellendorffii]